MSMTHDDLLRFMREELEIDTTQLVRDSPLFSAGVIDSFSLVTLLSHIENTCGFRVGATDVNLDNFDSIERITAYISRMEAQKSWGR
jgi:acyl carrier protein